MQQNLQKLGAGQEQRCTKSDGPVIKPRQPLSRITRSIMALVAHFLPCNFVKFAGFLNIAECIGVGSAHTCLPIITVRRLLGDE